MAGRCGVILKGFDKGKREEVSAALQRLLELGPGQASDILDSVPIVLFEKLTKAVSEVVFEKMSELKEAGAEIEQTSKVPSHLPRIDWPEPLPIVLEAEEEVETAKSKKAEPKEKKEEAKEKEGDVVPKYEFVVDERNIFTCPACGAMFLLNAMSKEEAQEARAQNEIKKLLEMKDELTPAPAAAEVDEGESSTIEGLPVDEDLPIVEEGTVDEEMKAFAAPLPDDENIPRIKATDEFIGMEEFERGLAEEAPVEEAGEMEEVTTGTATAPADALPVADDSSAEEGEVSEGEGATGEEPVPLLSGSDYGEALMEELETLPEEKPPVVLEGVREEPEVEEAREEVPPEELLRYIDERKKQKEAAGVKGRVVAQPPGRAPRAVRPTRLSRAKRKEAKAEEETEKGGNYGVVVSRLTTTEKKRKAAEIMEEELDIPLEEGMRICSGGLIINVARGLELEKAKALYLRFREIGIMARITEHKRRRR